MQIVTDSGVDFAPEQLKGLEISVVPLMVMMNGRTYRSGVDLHTDEFYRMLDESNVFPTTSQPSAGDFADLYRSLAAKDKDIISLHLSSNLSGTYNSARLGAEQVPEANITLVDTRTVSAALGWVVEAVGKANKAGWTREEIMPLIKLINDKTDIVYTIATLKYLVHGGRIGRVKGLVGSLMDFKPIIGIDKTEGINVPKGQVRTMKKGILHIAELITHQYEPGTEMRFQLLSGNNLEGANILKERLDQLYKCHFVETVSISPVIAAHTGSGLVGVTYGPWDAFANLPWMRSS
jgi:DegV family protein with EDD domain